MSRKRDEHNRIIRHKARWVEFGNHQIRGVDYADTYASVGSVNSLRILLAIATRSSWIIWQFDVKTAFLNRKIDGTVYVKQVQDFEHPSHPHCVWLLNQSLYGTKQAARCWQQDFNEKASKFNLKPCPSDSAVYVVQDERGILIIHLHVDDSLVFCSSESLIVEFQSFLNSQYEVKWTKQPPSAWVSGSIFDPVVSIYLNRSTLSPSWKNFQCQIVQRLNHPSPLGLSIPPGELRRSRKLLTFPTRAW